MKSIDSTPSVRDRLEAEPVVPRETAAPADPAPTDPAPPDPAPPVPEPARTRFPVAADGLAAYADLLASEGVVRGLIGPREVPRLWDRHLLNCAVVEELIPVGLTVADVGSGAGLPGLALAIVRPDLRLTLIEPMLRRSTFLHEAVELLGLGNVEVLRGRAEELSRSRRFDVVTSRAVAPLDKLAAWCAPILASEGRMLALKGERAEAELAESAGTLARLGLGSGRIVRIGEDVVPPGTTVVELRGRVRAATRSERRASERQRSDQQQSDQQRSAQQRSRRGKGRGSP